MKTKNNVFSIGIISIIIASSLYGVMPVVSKWLVSNNVNEMEMTVLRFAFSAIGALVVCLVRKKSLKINFGQLKALLIFGVVGYGITSYLLAAAVKHIDAGLTTVIHFLFPVVTVIITRTIFKEKISKKQWISVILALFGALLLAVSSIKGNASIFGIALAAISSVTYSVYLIGSERSVLKDMDEFLVVFYYSAFNAILFFFVRLLSGGWGGNNLNLTAYALISVQAVMFTIIPLALLAHGLARIGAAKGSILNLFEPIVAMACSIIIFKESLTLPSFIGCAVLLVSVLIITTDKKVI